VARIRIYVRQSPRAAAETVADKSGNPIALPFLRLFALIRIGLQARRLADCIIDTGAPLTVFPRQAWNRFASEIEWLTLPPAQVKDSWVTNLRGRTGGTSECRIGRIFVEAFDVEDGLRFLPGSSVLAQFEEKETAEDRIIVGLYGGILEGRRLILEPDLRQAWIEEC
jgi:hypothetical protein